MPGSVGRGWETGWTLRFPGWQGDNKGVTAQEAISGRETKDMIQQVRRTLLRPRESRLSRPVPGTSTRLAVFTGQATANSRDHIVATCGGACKCLVVNRKS